MNDQPSCDRPVMRVVLAMSADGKIADRARSPARFGSATDQRHLQEQVAACDAVLIGAETLRVYGTSVRVSAIELLQQRQDRGKPPQPIQIVCSASGNINPHIHFFQQPIPRWLVTFASGAQRWQATDRFDRLLIQPANCFNWMNILSELSVAGISEVAVLGGGELVASLLAVGCIDEIFLTVCPLLLGGHTAPTPIAGQGFPESLAPRLQLLSVRSVDQEVFLHYRVCHP